MRGELAIADRPQYAQEARALCERGATMVTSLSAPSDGDHLFQLMATTCSD
jgi:hypothetical protein